MSGAEGDGTAAFWDEDEFVPRKNNIHCQEVFGFRLNDANQSVP